ncbi:DUF6515 family protein [Methylomonas methanica]|uniref:Nickel/cobalt transporter regulator n=1 Tax=Methylomonas methanica (strain DSM 25384 / MC09) TaxID=857087 RepID=F9ZWR8_METMM|nr:DUF6515 family protein [Methylomonas methanica]AEG02080.1 hypothetical protein Metme_3722 [Methylomonas methanica MC09]
MNTLNIKHILGIGLLVLLSQQAAVAGDWRNSQHDRGATYRQQSPVSRQSDYRHEERYYHSGHAAAPLPRGYSRVHTNAGEYFYANGSFYRPTRHGYVAVAAPIGAVLGYLPRFNRVSYARGLPYYVAGNTFFRRHGNGYVVVPNPARGYRH